MLFGVSYSEWFIVLAISAAILGPKDIPIVAKAAGHVVGKGVGYLMVIRGRFEGFAEKSQIPELHREVAETIAQLEAIRAEIRGGASILRPSSLTSQALHAAAGRSQASATEGTQAAAAQPAATKQGRQQWSQSTLPQEQTSSPRPNGFPTGASVQKRSAPVGSPLTVSAIANAAASARNRAAAVESGRQEGVAGLEIHPVTAVSAGLVPRRTDAIPGGADILSDAILEQQVAFETRKLMKSLQEKGLPGQIPQNAARRP